MAVNKNSLKKNIQKIWDSQPSKTTETAKKLAQAYDSYCQTALFGASKPTIPPTQKQALEKTLLSGINAQNIDAFCASVQNGIVTYWTGVPIAGPSGTGNSLAPTGNIITTLKTALIQPYPENTSDSAEALANNMDVLSKTVTASLVIPPASAVVFTLG